MDYTKEAHIFRKKPTTVSAIQWTGTNYEEVKAFFSDDAKKTCGPMLDLDGKPEKGDLVIETLEGNMRASPGDFIIRGIKGEYYPCKPDIFEATYEVVS